MNNKFESFATKVASKLTKEPGIDPITIIMIVGVLVNVIRLINECNKSAVDARDMQEDEFSKRQLAKACRQYLPYGKKNKARELAAGIIETAKEATDEEIQNLLN